MSTAKKITVLVLVLTILLLFISFLYIDLVIKPNNSFLSDILKYFSICLCFIISTLIQKDCISEFDKKLLQIGLFFTVIADLCLLFLNQYVLGVAVFSVVQICYIIRFNRNNYFIHLLRLLLFLLVLFIIEIILKTFYIKIGTLYILSVFYLACLLTSVVSAIRTKKNRLLPSVNSSLAALGMILFMLCDINVGLYNITSQVYNLNFIWINQLSSDLIWIFYLPSQILLSLSGFKFYKEFN